jgi:hypothetical protein
LTGPTFPGEGSEKENSEVEEEKMPKDLLKNKEYDLVSVIYNASQAAETCQQYVKDAQGDKEVERYFNNVIDSNADLIQQGKALLKNRLE